MKRLSLAVCALAVTVILTGVAQAGNGAPSGPHWNVNLIGFPKGEKPGNGDTSGGASLFIPLKTVKSPTNQVFCTSDDGIQTEFRDEIVPTFGTQEPTGGVRIYFEPSTAGQFEILDRDATDGEARILIPVSDDDSRFVTVDLWVRVLGKPGGCAEISGYAKTLIDGTQLWWYSGSVLLDRETGKSTFVNATGIFDVMYCPVTLDPTTNTYVCSGPAQELSVFNDVFDDYFWQVLNDGTRLIQMRFYKRPAVL